MQNDVKTIYTLVRPHQIGEGLEVSIPKSARDVIGIDQSTYLLLRVDGRRLVYEKESDMNPHPKIVKWGGKTIEVPDLNESWGP